MNTRLASLFLLVLVTTLTFMFFIVAVAQTNDPCDRDPETIKVKIKEKNNTPTKVTKGLFGSDADSINACRGDTIQWKLSGKKFFIKFPNESPFRNKEKTSSNGKLEITIGSEAKDGASYKYDIGIDGGGVLDPIIIIDNRTN